jgi:hypothetical protein
MTELPNGDLYVNEYSFGTPGVTEGAVAQNLYKSSDSGVTWVIDFSYPANLLRHLHMIASDGAGVMYLSGAHPQGDNTDVAATWIYDPITKSLSDPIQPKGIGNGMTGFVETDNNRKLFASDATNGVFALVNGSFENIADIDYNLLTIAKGRDGVIYTVTNTNAVEEVYASADDGTTWIKFKLHNVTVRPSTVLTVGNGPVPYIYWDGSTDQNYRRLKDYTRAELKALYTSNLQITGTIY